MGQLDSGDFAHFLIGDNNLFLQVLELCRQAGLVKLGHVALGGTKVRANASKHKAMSYGRMKERDGQLSAEVAELLRRAGGVDDDEDRRYGKDKRGDELPEELAFRGGRLRRIRAAKAALEAGALAEMEQAESEGRNHPGVPDDKAQWNFTDPDSRIMPGPGGRDFQQSYNCQAVVDNAHQVIVAARATNQASDKGQAVGMIEETVSNTGAVPKEVSADAGYYSAKAVEELYPLVSTRSLRRRRPAMAGYWSPRPVAAYPRDCPPGNGCAVSCGRNGDVNATPSGWSRWSRCSARSSRAGATGSSCCWVWRR